MNMPTAALGLWAVETTATDIGLWAVVVAVVGGAIRVGTPYLFVSLGECLTERAGRVNLGLEGTLVMGAMSAYGVSCLVGTKSVEGLEAALGALEPDVVETLSPWQLSFGQSLADWGVAPESLATAAPWLGVLAAAFVGGIMGLVHAVICNRPRVNSVAVGIAMMIFGLGLAYYLGKSFINPVAPKLPPIEFGNWSSIEQIQFALKISPLFLFGLALTPLLAWMLYNTRWGMIVRLAGENQDAAAAMGYSVPFIRICATAAGGVLAGMGGAYLGLFYPGSWNEQISSGQGLMAVALVIFARWDPVRCLWASLLFGGVGSFGSVLQGQQQNLTGLFESMGGFGSILVSMNLFSAAAAHVWNALPYILTVVIMIITCSRAHAMVGAPGELSVVR